MNPHGDMDMSVLVYVLLLAVMFVMLAAVGIAVLVSK